MKEVQSKLNKKEKEREYVINLVNKSIKENEIIHLIDAMYFAEEDGFIESIYPYIGTETDYEYLIDDEYLDIFVSKIVKKYGWRYVFETLSELQPSQNKSQDDYFVIKGKKVYEVTPDWIEKVANKLIRDIQQ